MASQTYPLGRYLGSLKGARCLYVWCVHVQQSVVVQHLLGQEKVVPTNCQWSVQVNIYCGAVPKRSKCLWVQSNQSLAPWSCWSIMALQCCWLSVYGRASLCSKPRHCTTLEVLVPDTSNGTLCPMSSLLRFRPLLLHPHRARPQVTRHPRRPGNNPDRVWQRHLSSGTGHRTRRRWDPFQDRTDLSLL